MKTQHQANACVLLLCLISCASPGPTAPQASFSQVSKYSQMLVDSAGGMPIEYRLQVHNPLDQPVTLVSVEFETVGESGSYRLDLVRHAFSIVIAPGSSEDVDFRAWVRPLTRDQKGDVSSPVLLRGTAHFETAHGMVKRNFAARGQ